MNLEVTDFYELAYLFYGGPLVRTLVQSPAEEVIETSGVSCCFLVVVFFLDYFGLDFLLVV